MRAPGERSGCEARAGATAPGTTMSKCRDFGLSLASAILSLRAFGFLHLLCWIEPVDLAAAGTNDFRFGRPLGRFDLAGNRPEETNQLASDRCDRHDTFLADGQLFESFVKPLLSFPGDHADCFGLVLLPFLHGFADERSQAVVPGRFGEHTPAVRVAAF